MKLKTLRTFVWTLFLFTLNNANAQVQTPRYISTASNSKAFYEYLPQGYNSESQSYPLLIFIHGIGEQGAGTSSSLPAVLRNGVPRLINEGGFPTSFTVNGQTHKFIVISPQFSSWPRPADLQSVIDYMVSHYRVNTGRIYMTGLSMGGGATWEYAGYNSSYASRLAAIVPIAGASWPDMTRSKNMGNADLAVWATHNQGDDQVPATYTSDYVKNINSVNPNPLARKTVFSASGHDAWSTTYSISFKENNLNIYQWMLQYQRGTSTPVNQAPLANAGSDRVITLPSNSVSLSGSGTDPDGSISRYAWTKISGPTQFTISNSAITNPVVSNLVAGTYSFRLTVTDNANATAYDDVTVRVDQSGTQLPPPSGTKLIPGKIEAESYDNMNGIRTENTRDAGGGLNINYVHYKDWLDYNVYVASSGVYTVNLRLASNVNKAQLQIQKGGTSLATVDVPNTGGYQTWTTVSTTVSLQAGSQTIRIYSSNSGAWFLNWMDFVSGTVTNSAVQQSGIMGTDGNSDRFGQPVADPAFREKLGMYPNPVAGNFTLRLDNNYTGLMNVQILDITGGIRKEYRIPKNQPSVQYNLSTEGLAAGTYFIRVQIGSWKNSLKMVKL